MDNNVVTENDIKSLNNWKDYFKKDSSSIYSYRIVNKITINGNVIKKGDNIIYIYKDSMYESTNIAKSYVIGIIREDMEMSDIRRYYIIVHHKEDQTTYVNKEFMILHDDTTVTHFKNTDIKL